MSYPEHPQPSGGPGSRAYAGHGDNELAQTAQRSLHPGPYAGGAIAGGVLASGRGLPRDPHGPTFIQDQTNRVAILTKDVNDLNRELGELVLRLQRHVDGIIGCDPPNDSNGRAQAEGPTKESSCSLEALQQAITDTDSGLHTTKLLLGYLGHQVERVERL